MTIRRTFPLLLILSGLACTPMKMGVPADLASGGDLLPITDRSRFTGALANESFKMGPYEIANGDRSWTSSSQSHIAVYSSGEAKNGYTFTFKTPVGEAKAECGWKAQEQTTKIRVFEIWSSQFNIGCVCEGPGASGKMQIESVNEGQLAGQVTAHANNFSISAIMQYDNGTRSREPLGYEIRSQSSLSAVDVSMPGKVWLSRSLDAQTRADLACLNAGLLLFIPPKSE